MSAIRLPRALRAACLGFAGALAATLLLAAPAAASHGGGGGGGGGGTPVLTALTLTPASVPGGSGVTGTATYSAPTVDGAVVELTSSNPAVATIGAQQNEVVVQRAQSTASFAIGTSAVTTTTTVTITGTDLSTGVAVSATLTVTPASGPPTTDTVHITVAEWKAGHLRIEATSTNAAAVLAVYGSDGVSFMFNLTNLGAGRYQDQRGWVFSPEQITVRSNFGGSDTRTITS